MQIAICDDSMQFRNEILSNLNHCTALSGENKYSQFSSAEDLLNAYNGGKRYDIIFLDVEMKNINGVDAGIKIRKYDTKVIIIFVSSYPKYAVPAYDCEAFYFIVKPIEQNKFIKVVNKAIEKYKLLHQYYIIKNKGDVKKIPINDICFLEIYRKHLIFHTVTGNYETIGKISEALVELSPYGFCQVHQGYLVNMNHIKKFENYDIILLNKERVMMSIRKRSDVLKEYANYLERNF